MAQAQDAEARRSFPWWRCCLGYLAMEVYVFTGARCALLVMEWATRPAP